MEKLLFGVGIIFFIFFLLRLILYLLEKCGDNKEYFYGWHDLIISLLLWTIYLYYYETIFKSFILCVIIFYGLFTFIWNICIIKDAIYFKHLPDKENVITLPIILIIIFIFVYFK